MVSKVNYSQIGFIKKQVDLMLKQWLLIIMLSFIFVVSGFVWAASENDFWLAIQKGDYLTAGNLAREIGTTTPEYYSLAAVCYQNQAKYDEFQIYQNKFYRLGSPAKAKEILASQLSMDAADGQILLFEENTTIIFPEIRLGDPQILLQKAKATLKDNPFLYNYLGLNEMINNHNYSKEVEQYFQKAISFKKDFPEAYNNLAVLLTQNNENEKAIAVLLESLNNCPDVPADTYDQLISLTSIKGTLTVRPFGKPMQVVTPVLKEGYRNKIQSSLVKSPKHLLRLAESFIIKGNADSGRSLLTGVNFDNDNQALYNYILLRTYHLENNSEQMAAAGVIILGNKELDYQRLSEAGNVFFYAKNFKMAVNFYEAALLKINPDDGENAVRIYSNLGTIYYLTGEYEKAILNLNQALSYDPQDAISLVNLGLTFREQGDKGKAGDYLTKALENIRDPEWHKEIEDILAELKQADSIKYFK